MNQNINYLFKKLDSISSPKVRNVSTGYISAILFLAGFGVLPKVLTFLVGCVPLGLLLAWQVNREQTKSTVFVANVFYSCLLTFTLVLSAETLAEYRLLLMFALSASGLLVFFGHRLGATSENKIQYDPQASLDGITLDGGLSDFGMDSLGDDITFTGGDYGRTNEESIPDDRPGDSDDMLLDSTMSDLSSRYEIVSELGKGGMGEVLLATDKRLDRKVAIKRILQGQSRTAAETFLAEAQTVAKLNHPNIVQVYDYGVDRSGPYIVMEYVDGGSLLELSRTEKIELDRVVEIISNLCDGLSNAHAEGIIHRDIKPGNILLSRQGTPKLSDFGLATSQAALMANSAAIVGTLDFMAPEQRTAAIDTDHRSDIYSLGATMYQLITGRSPKLIKLDEIPKQLHDTIVSCLEDRKVDRFQSVDEFKQALMASFNATMAIDREFADGECPECGIINKVESTFCRHCGSQLSYDCLKCGELTAVWDKICNSCGANQHLLIQDLRGKQIVERQECDSLLNKCRFAQSHKLADKIRDSSLPQLPVQTWYDQFIKKLERRKKAELDRAKELVVESNCHQIAYDYESAIQCLELIPEPIRHLAAEGDLEINSVLKTLVEKKERLKELEAEVKEAVTAGRLNGLLPIFDELLELRPDRPSVIAYREKLLARHTALLQKRESAADAAVHAFNNQLYANALKLLESIPQEAKSDEDIHLEKECKRLIGEIDILRNDIADRVKAEEFYGLLELVESCLALDSKQQDLQKVKIDLLAFEDKVSRRVATAEQHIRQLLPKLAFEDAQQIIQRLPPQEHSEIFCEYLQRFEELIPLQKAAVEQLRFCQERQTNRLDRRVVQRYEIALAKSDLSDPRLKAFHAEMAGIKKRRNSIWLALLVAGMGLAGVYVIYEQFLQDDLADRNAKPPAISTDE